MPGVSESQSAAQDDRQNIGYVSCVGGAIVKANRKQAHPVSVTQQRTHLDDVAPRSLPRNLALESKPHPTEPEGPWDPLVVARYLKWSE